MPGLDGLEALRKIRRHKGLSDVLIVLMTGQRALKMQPGFRELGIIGIIYKPLRHAARTYPLSLAFSPYG
jgi:CheY-like chemotaxis protein